MSEKKKFLKDFPARKANAGDVAQHAAYLAWFRMTLQPRYTEGIRYGFGVSIRHTSRGYILRANNQAAIGFPATPGILDLCYLHPESHGAWFHIDLVRSPIKQWREGGISDKAFAFHRKHMPLLFYRLHYWRENIPPLMDYLGCAGDLRFVAKVTLALNYTVPNSTHETPKNHTIDPHFPGLEFPS